MNTMGAVPHHQSHPSVKPFIRGEAFVQRFIRLAISLVCTLAVMASLVLTLPTDYIGPH
jgi:hypothetical protein